MPDVYSHLTELDPSTIEMLGQAMEMRAADPVQRGFVASYISRLTLPEAARVLEIGCGTGAIARMLAQRPGIGEVVGVDAGFVEQQLTSHGYAQVVEPGYMLWLLGRGAEILVTEGVIGPALADSLRAEARRRVSQGSLFGQVTYISVVARRGR